MFSSLMSKQELKKQVLALFKNVSNDLNKEVSHKSCNCYINKLEALKEQLNNEGLDWVEDYDELETVDEQSDLFDGTDEDEIQNSMEEVHSQLESILSDLGVEDNKSETS